MQNNVLDYLNEIVKKKPDKLAFSNGTEGLTFAEVYKQSRAIGTFLNQKGIYQKPVVIFMNKSPKEVTAFFGVITAGCFYVPVDEEMPADRIALILDNVKSPLIICDEHTIEQAKQFAFSGELVLYDEICQTAIDDVALKKIYDKAIDTDCIYIVFTHIVFKSG